MITKADTAASVMREAPAYAPFIITISFQRMLKKMQSADADISSNYALYHGREKKSRQIHQASLTWSAIRLAQCPHDDFTTLLKASGGATAKRCSPHFDEYFTMLVSPRRDIRRHFDRNAFGRFCYYAGAGRIRQDIIGRTPFRLAPGFAKSQAYQSSISADLGGARCRRCRIPRDAQKCMGYFSSARFSLFIIRFRRTTPRDYF